MSGRNYDAVLSESGMASTRVEEISDAMDQLHKALSKCDFSNRRLFFSKDIVTRLKEYATATDMADVTDTGKRVTNCYVPVKKEGDYLIGLKIKDTPGTQLMCQDKAADGTPIAISFHDFKEAAGFCMARNLEMGLKADDVADIVKSTDVARDLQVRAKALLEKHADVMPASITIQKDQNGEYRVPGPAGKEEAAASYTSDKEDAVGTAKAMHGQDITIKFKNVEQHMSVEDKKPAVDVPVNSGRSRR